MEFGWLQLGSVKLIAALPSWLGIAPAGWLAAMAGAGAVVLAIALLLSFAGAGAPLPRGRSACGARRRS